MDSMRTRVTEAHHALAKKTHAAIQLYDEYVQRKPWTSTAIGAGIGTILVLLLAYWLS